MRLLLLLAGGDLVTGPVDDLTAVLPTAHRRRGGRSRDVLCRQPTVLVGRSGVRPPATLYGGGLRRGYAALAETPDDAPGYCAAASRSCHCWSWPPLLLLAVLGITPVLNRLAGKGVAAATLGVWLALTVNWLVLARR